MKSSILLLAFAALAFSSCTSAYKTGQTPDDVYYSPVREQDEYVVVDKREDRSYQGSEEYYEDRFLRYRARNPYRWSALDDYYWNTPYAWHYGGYTSWYSPYSSYHCWNNYYNPYYPGVIVINKPVYNYRPPSRPIAFNPGSYNSGSSGSRSVFSSSRYNSNNSRYNNSNGSRYNNSNRNSFGNSVKRVFSNSGSSRPDYSNGNSTPSRSYNPPSSSSSSSGRSSGGSSGGGGGVSRPAR